MLKKIVGFLAFAMTILSFGAYIGLIKDGGARDQGLDNAIPYNGPLNALPIVWGSVTLAVVFFVVDCLQVQNQTELDLAGSRRAINLLRVVGRGAQGIFRRGFTVDCGVSAGRDTY
jgi:hypothetical protein